MWPYNLTEWQWVSGVNPKTKKKSFWKKLLEAIQETQTKRAEYKIKHRLYQ